MKARLIQPTSSNYDTGGYLYNARLADRGCFVLETIERAELVRVPTSQGETIIVDSLFLDVDPSSVPWLDRVRTIALVHHLSCLTEPVLDPRCAELQWLARVDAIVVTSFFMARRIAALVPETPVEVCRPGLDSAHLGAARRVSHSPPCIVSVGHIIPRKGYLEAAQALAAVSQVESGPWRWRVVGDDRFEPDYARRFQARVDELGLRPRLEFLGPLSPAATAGWYPKSDVFLLPSSFEAFGMAYAEALAAGLPVVAFDAGEVGDLVPPGHGTVCPVGDVDALSEALASWLRWARTDAILPPFALSGWDGVAEEFERVASRFASR